MPNHHCFTKDFTLQNQVNLSFDGLGKSRDVEGDGRSNRCPHAFPSVRARMVFGRCDGMQGDHPEVPKRDGGSELQLDQRNVGA